jgi:hypothetical protein
MATYKKNQTFLKLELVKVLLKKFLMVKKYRLMKIQNLLLFNVTVKVKTWTVLVVVLQNCGN